MADIKIKKFVYSEGDQYQSRVLFEWEGEELPEDTEKVNLSRNGTNPACWFRPDQVANHDDHAPAFTSEEAESVYTERVQKDIASCLSTVEPQDPKSQKLLEFLDDDDSSGEEE